MAKIEIDLSKLKAVGNHTNGNQGTPQVKANFDDVSIFPKKGNDNTFREVSKEEFVNHFVNLNNTGIENEEERKNLGNYLFDTLNTKVDDNNKRDNVIDLEEFKYFDNLDGQEDNDVTFSDVGALADRTFDELSNYGIDEQVLDEVLNSNSTEVADVLQQVNDGTISEDEATELLSEYAVQQIESQQVEISNDKTTTTSTTQSYAEDADVAKSMADKGASIAKSIGNGKSIGSTLQKLGLPDDAFNNSGKVSVRASLATAQAIVGSDSELFNKLASQGLSRDGLRNFEGTIELNGKASSQDITFYPGDIIFEDRGNNKQDLAGTVLGVNGDKLLVVHGGLSQNGVKNGVFVEEVPISSINGYIPTGKESYNTKASVVAEQKAAEEAKLAEQKAAEEAKLAEQKAAEEAKLAEQQTAEEAEGTVIEVNTVSMEEWRNGGVLDDSGLHETNPADELYAMGTQEPVYDENGFLVNNSVYQQPVTEQKTADVAYDENGFMINPTLGKNTEEVAENSAEILADSMYEGNQLPDSEVGGMASARMASNDKDVNDVAKANITEPIVADSIYSDGHDVAESQVIKNEDETIKKATNIGLVELAKLNTGNKLISAEVSKSMDILGLNENSKFNISFNKDGSTSVELNNNTYTFDSNGYIDGESFNSLTDLGLPSDSMYKLNNSNILEAINSRTGREFTYDKLGNALSGTDITLNALKNNFEIAQKFIADADYKGIELSKEAPMGLVALGNSLGISTFDSVSLDRESFNISAEKDDVTYNVSPDGTVTLSEMKFDSLVNDNKKSIPESLQKALSATGIDGNSKVKVQYNMSDSSVTSLEIATKDGNYEISEDGYSYTDSDNSLTVDHSDDGKVTGYKNVTSSMIAQLNNYLKEGQKINTDQLEGLGISKFDITRFNKAETYLKTDSGAEYRIVNGSNIIKRLDGNRNTVTSLDDFKAFSNCYSRPDNETGEYDGVTSQGAKIKFSKDGDIKEIKNIDLSELNDLYIHDDLSNEALNLLSLADIDYDTKFTNISFENGKLTVELNNEKFVFDSLTNIPGDLFDAFTNKGMNKAATEYKIQPDGKFIPIYDEDISMN